MTYKTLTDLGVPIVNLLSATPMLNKHVGLVGFLAMLWSEPEDEKTIYIFEKQTIKLEKHLVRAFSNAESIL